MLRRATLFLLFILSGIILLSFIPPQKNNQKTIKTIIVDAGHGIMNNGGHNGAKGSYSYEDDICLAVSKELIAQLKEQLPEVRIVETRPDERIVPLHRRAEIANQNKGDLFICIHANAMPPIRHSELKGYKKVTNYTGKGKRRRKVTKKVPQYHTWTTPKTTTKGAETYIWGAHENEDKEVAMREIAPMLEEENFKENYGDIVPNSPEFIALSLLKTKQYFKRSATLAGFVQDEFARVGRVDREVRQRQVGIWVLQATAMPSVLVETGYITNPSEENYLNSKEGQNEIATCITNAVKTYIAWLEKQAGSNSINAKNNSEPVLNDTKSFLNMVERKEKKALK
jgi:N-acetylmuramoyl-L-alanine amidase